MQDIVLTTTESKMGWVNHVVHHPNVNMACHHVRTPSSHVEMEAFEWRQIA